MNPQKTKTYTLRELCAHTGGKLQGDPEVRITGVCALDDQKAGAISFIKDTTSSNLAALIENSVVSAFFISDRGTDTLALSKGNYIFVADPYAALVSTIPLFIERIRPADGVSPKADVDPTAKLAPSVSVGAFAVIGARCSIGDNSIIHPNVVIYPDVSIGNNCIVHAGSVIRENCRLGNDSVIQPGVVIGGEGFGYAPDPKLGLRPIPQIGGVQLGDRVDVGANSCIDRATLGKTTIGAGTKIDNLVQIGHNVRIGTNGVLCAQVGIAGSSTIGDRCVFAGQAGVADHLTVPSDVRLAAKAGVTASLEEPGDYGGCPTSPAKDWHRQMLALRRLPALFRQVRKLVKEE